MLITEISIVIALFFLWNILGNAHKMYYNTLHNKISVFYTNVQKNAQQQQQQQQVYNYYTSYPFFGLSLYWYYMLNIVMPSRDSCSEKILSFLSLILVITLFLLCRWERFFFRPEKTFFSVLFSFASSRYLIYYNYSNERKLHFKSYRLLHS